MNNILPWILIFLAVIVSSVSQIVLKKSASREHSSLVKEYLNPYVIIGYSLMIISTLLVVFSYKLGLEYKNGPVIESLGYVLIMFLSLLFFKEKITWRKIVGNALVIIGIAVFYL